MSTERTNIAILGRCNAGKSTLANRLTGQDMSIVSATRGTTTDPVQKAMEINGLGAGSVPFSKVPCHLSLKSYCGIK